VMFWRDKIILKPSSIVARRLKTLESTSPWRLRQHSPPKRWYPTISLYGVTTQEITTLKYFKFLFLREFLVQNFIIFSDSRKHDWKLTVMSVANGC
jgi:hypothetical protein